MTEDAREWPSGATLNDEFLQGAILALRQRHLGMKRGWIPKNLPHDPSYVAARVIDIGAFKLRDAFLYKL